MIVVTGGAGYIGSHIVWALVDQRVPCMVIDDLRAGSPLLIPACVPLEAVDCGDRERVTAILKARSVSGIIHCAGSVSVVESVAEPLLYYRNNLAASISLFQAAIDAGVETILFSSTATVYGAPDLRQLSEELPVAPVNPYAASKAMVERVLCDLARATSIKAVILRYFNVAGADPELRTGQLSPNPTHLIKRAVLAALSPGQPITVTGTDYPTPDGTGVRDYVHVSDLADAHVLALEAARNTEEPLILNIGYGRGASVLEVLDAVDRVNGRAVPREVAGRRPGDVPALVADPAKALRLLGWVPRRAALDVIVRDAMAWERKIAADPGRYLPGRSLGNSRVATSRPIAAGAAVGPVA